MTVADAASLRRHFLRGALASAPMLLVLVPFASLFGLVSAEAGLDIWQISVLSLAVFAGASQLTAVQMMQDNAPVFMVLLTSLAVNLRLAMYSASLTQHLGALSLRWRLAVAYLLVDQSYAASISEFERNPSLTLSEKLAYFMGSVGHVVTFWFVFTLLGAYLGSYLPADSGIDFAMPVTFIAMVAPMLRSVPHLAAAFVAVVGSLLFSGLPFSAGILVAAMAAMVTGALVEGWLEARK